MGVKDLGAVIKKHAPAAVTQIASLSAFANRAVAIDANLLTTKFHYTKSDSPHRHVRSWYWFLQALEKEKIRPIIVFDGATRVPEKEKENKRRRAAREEQQRRGEAEQLRGERLREIRSAWDDIAKEDRTAVAAELKRSPQGAEEVAEEVDEIEERIRTSAAQLATLRSAFEADSTNPVYSRNQVLITAEERSFFTQLLARDEVVQLESPHERNDSEALVRIIGRSDALGQSHRSRATPVPSSAFTDTIRLIKALGIPYIQPAPHEPHEAEGLCATLYSLGLVDAVVSEDTDVAVYGAPLIRRISTSTLPTKGKEGMSVLNPYKLREELKLSHEQFVDFALLCGTDFTQRIPLLGPAKALAFVREHETIEKILAVQDKYLPANLPEYLDSIRAARAIFLSLPTLPPDASLTPTEPDPLLPDLLLKWGIRLRRDVEEIVEAEEDDIEEVFRLATRLEETHL